jgi:hypothetical protein
MPQQREKNPSGMDAYPRRPLTELYRSIGFAPILDRKDVNSAALHSPESHAPIADSEPVGAGKFPLQRCDVTFTSLSVMCRCEQYPHRRCAFDSAKLGAGT